MWSVSQPDVSSIARLAQLTLLGLKLVISLPVWDAELVEVLRLAEGSVQWPGAELARDRADMIDNLLISAATRTAIPATHNVDHEEHPSGMQRIREVQEVLWRAKFAIQLCPSASFGIALIVPNMFDVQ